MHPGHIAPWHGRRFRRSLHVPERVADAAKRLRHGRTIRIDVGRVRFADGVERNFVNSASFGLSAAVAARVNRAAQKALLNYAKETASAVKDFEHPAVRLGVDDRPATGRVVTLVSLHNGRFFGGGMKMAPEADLQDGKLQAVIVDKMPTLKLLRKAPTIYFGAHTGLTEVETGSLQRLEAEPVDADTKIPVEVDGETPGHLPATFDVVPSALCIRIGR